MAKKKASAPPDPNRLVRVSAGRYRSEDVRFEVREGGTGWFVTDAQQTNEFGQQLVIGPFATLAAVREALPDARRHTLKPLPRPSVPSEPARSGGGAARRAKPKPTAKPKPAPEHRLVKVLRDAARDRFPAADLAVEVLAAPPGPAAAVVAFSGHSVIAAGVDAADVRAHLPGDDPGGSLSAPFLTWLGLQLATPPGSVDIVLVADGTGRPDEDHPLTEVEAPDPAIADRVERARRHRSEVRLFTDPQARGGVILGRGLALRREVSLEVAPKRRGHGVGTALARAARGLVPEGEPLYAQVAPGNVASLRAFLRAGYRPIGAEALFLTRPVTD